MRNVWLLVLMLAILLVAPFASPYNPKRTDEINYGVLHAPSAAHPFGTDELARDVLSRVLVGAQLSVELSLSAVAIALLIGTTIGVLSAMIGGFADAFVMRGIDTALAIPRVLLLLPVAAAFRALPLWLVALLIGCTGWFDIARLVRGEVQALLTRDFVLASKATGVGHLRLVTRHIFPHLIPTLLVVGTLALGTTVVLEAGLTYLGLSLQSGAISLGTLLQGSMNNPSKWWLSVFPGLTIVLIMLACNILGDALRETFAPQQLHA